MSPPKEKGAPGSAPLLDQLSLIEYRWSPYLQAHWRREARRLLAEYERTGHPAHLKAYRTHRSAMQGWLQQDGGSR